MSIWSLTKSNFHTAMRGVHNAHQSARTSNTKIASGRRINHAADDSAGLAVSTNLDSQRMSTATARRNANDSLATLDITSGALYEANNMMKRMRELSVQASSETLEDTERAYLETEFRTISAELTRIRDITEFNGIRLADGSQSTRAGVLSTNVTNTVLKAGRSKINDVTLGGAINDGVSTHDPAASALSKATSINLLTDSHGVTANAFNEQTAEVPIESGAILMQVVINGERLTNDPSLKATKFDSDGLVRGLINSLTDKTGVWADLDDQQRLILTAVDGRNMNVERGNMLGYPIGGIHTYSGQLSLRSDSEIKLEVAHPFGLIDGTYAASEGLEAQIGSHNTANDRIATGIESISDVGALKIDRLSLSSQAAAQSALEFIDKGVDHINQQQTRVGSSINRLNNTLNHLMNTEQHLQAAESQIADTDMALESAALARANILRTASESILAQAKDLSRVTVRLIE